MNIKKGLILFGIFSIIFLFISITISATKMHRRIIDQEKEFFNEEIVYGNHRIYGRQIDAEKFCNEVKNLRNGAEQFRTLSCDDINLRNIKPVFWMGYGWDIPDLGMCDPRYGILTYVRCN